MVAFRQILPQKFLNLFPFEAMNVHGSLLPRWQKAAPIQKAIEAGDQESGVSLQKIVKELDAGDIIGTRRLALDENITAKELHDKLAVLGAELLKVELMDFIRGNLAPIPQDSQFVTHAKKITKTESEIDWSQSAKSIHNKIRALTMGPGTWTSFQAKKIKIHRSQIAATKSSGQPGEIVQAQGDNLTLATGSGDLQILELQPESRNRMSATDFLKAQMIKKGDILGAR
jgi:methionyl-tRNA formyltransferase